MATPKVTLSVDGNVGVITIKNPPVNSLAPDGTFLKPYVSSHSEPLRQLDAGARVECNNE